MSKRITMADVARDAGVSQMTVSRVINNREGTSATTRRRVLDTIERLGYRPSGIARGLATNRTKTLGLIVPDVSNPFFSSVARGVEHVAHTAGYNVFLCNTEEDPERELAVLESLEEKQVDGLVLCSSRLGEDALRDLVARQRAVVLVNRRLSGGPVRSALVDDEAGGRLAVEHLLRAGHRRIGFLAGPPASHSGRERAKGYQAVLTAAGYHTGSSLSLPCSPDVAGGARATRQFLAEHPDATALFCYNDLVAVGALQACAELGIRVPGEIAIIGHDDIMLAALVTPSLTTCRVPRYELGVEAVRLLLAQLQAQPGECDEIVLRAELVVRASAP